MTDGERKELESALAQWEGDGGATAPEPVQSEGLMKPSKMNRLEAALMTLVVGVTHLLPFSGAFGYSLFATDSCGSIAALFSFLSAFMLTARVLFRHNTQIGKLIAKTRMLRVWVIEAIGAAIALAWLSPFYAVAHGMADASIAALGVTVSILATAAVSNPSGRGNLGQDLASVFVLAFAFAWTHSLPHFHGTPHGEEFLGAVTIGSSSLHSLRTMIEAMATCRSE